MVLLAIAKGEAAAAGETGGGVAGDANGEGAVGDATVPGNGNGGLTYPDRTVAQLRFKDHGWLW